MVSTHLLFPHTHSSPAKFVETTLSVNSWMPCRGNELQIYTVMSKQGSNKFEDYLSKLLIINIKQWEIQNCESIATTSSRHVISKPFREASASTLRQLWDDISNTVLIENNGVAPDWGCNPILSNSILFNENSIISINAEFSQHWHWWLV